MARQEPRPTEILAGPAKSPVRARLLPAPYTHFFRLERTFQIDAALTSKRDQRWIDEAIASGPETPLTKKEMDAIRDRVLRGKK